MNRIRPIRRAVAALVGLALTWLGLAVAAPAAFAMELPPSDGTGGAPASTGTGTVAHTVVVGGMPGWQIALIAVGAALVAAVLAVLAERVRAAHRRTALAAV